MSARIVSAEQARGLLEGATPGPWNVQPDGRDRVKLDHVETGEGSAAGQGSPVCSIPRARAGDAEMCAAAPDLAHTVITLEAERDAALARVARLERVLAVERGDASQAPSGWVGTPAGIGWDRGKACVWRLTVGRWRWRIGFGEVHDAETALEAMEAADAAGEVAPQ